MNAAAESSPEMASLLRLFGKEAQRSAPDNAPVLASCLREIAAYYQQPAIELEKLSAEMHTVHGLSRCYGLCYQRIQLTPQWWQNDCGAILIIGEHEQIYALLPTAKGYQLYDPLTHQRLAWQEGLFADVSLQRAYAFYPQLPDTKLSWRNLLSFITRGRKQELGQVIALQLFITLLGLFLPIITGLLIDQVIPHADYGLWLQITLMMLVNAVAMSAFFLSQYVSLMRIRLHSTVRLQTAIWQRVLRLPLAFFRQYMAGDLANRISVVDRIQQELTQNVIITTLGGIISLATLVLMFYYDVKLALIATAVTLLIVIFIGVCSIVQLRWQRLSEKCQGEMTAWFLQSLLAMNKLRAACAESVAKQRWLKLFVQKTTLFMRINTWQIYTSITASLLYTAATVLIFRAVVNRQPALSLGHFIAFNAAFSQFTASLLSLLGVITTVLRIIPLYERLQPILHAQPESYPSTSILLTSTSRLEIKGVSFQYQTEAPMVLKDVSLTVNSGQRIALVGPSGGGKSTLMRLLLGLDIPTAGQIFINGHDLQKINGEQWRQFIGVVSQQHLLFSGTIFDNIAGEHELTDAQAWEVLEQVNMVAEVTAMSMQLQTFVGENGNSLSMGQRQRLLLARALAKKPKILLLDEATSALDTLSQHKITACLSALAITQIIIAHRLTTVKDADYIYVLEQGCIIQEGDAKSLLADKNGFFAQAWQREQI